MTFLIDKEFDFDYGHRVWTQILDNKKYSIDEACVCRHLHGHRAKVQVFLEGDDLNPQGMVTDFKNLSWLKKEIDQYIDHRFIVDISDPLFDQLTMHWSSTRDIYIGGTIAGFEFDTTNSEISHPNKELLDGFIVVNFVPTSENLSKWMYEIVRNNMAKIGVRCSRVDWWETPKSRSSYRSE